jgi:hypothetical protein
VRGPHKGERNTNSEEEVSYGIRDYVVIGSAVKLDCPALVDWDRPLIAERRAPIGVPSLSTDAENDTTKLVDIPSLPA